MSNNLNELGIYDQVAEYLEKNLEKGEGVLELKCGNGDFAEFLAAKGFKNYHGIDDEGEAIKAAKSRVPKFKARFHTKDGNYKRNVVVCLNGTPFDTIESGQRMIVLTSGFDDYDKLCLAINGLYQDGAKTIEHGGLFITYGTRL